MLAVKQFFCLVVMILFISDTSRASACCGGGFAVPSIITGDDKAQFTSSWTQSEVDTDVLANGIWHKRSDLDQTQTLKIEAAHIFHDVFQMGVSIPLVTKRQNELGSSSGFSDSSVQVGYEYLPDWDYNPWRPKGVGFVSAIVPTGKYDITRQENRGRGFWALGIGTILTKTWTKWDSNSTVEIHRSFDRTVDNLQLKPGYGGSFTIGAGYNIDQWRIGSSLMWNYEDATRIEGANASSGSVERFATAALMTSYAFDNNLWAVTASYSDQTLFGEPLTTTLSKSAALTLQKRWSR